MVQEYPKKHLWINFTSQLEIITGVLQSTNEYNKQGLGQEKAIHPTVCIYNHDKCMAWQQITLENEWNYIVITSRI